MSSIHNTPNLVGQYHYHRFACSLNLHSLFIPPRGQLHTASAVKRASPRLRPTSSLRCHLGYALELEPKPYYPITVIERPARLIIGAVLVGGTSMLLASACAFLSRWRSASGGTLEPTWATGNKDEWLTEEPTRPRWSIAWPFGLRRRRE